MSSKVKRGAIAVLGFAALLSAGSAALAEEENTSSKLEIRNYDHFEFDAVVDSYFGIATFYTEDDKVSFDPQGVDGVDTDNEVFTGELRLVMAGETFQAGLVIPYHNTQKDALGGGKDDIGDIRLHVKLIPIRKEYFDAGAGLMLTFSGGGEDVGIGTDQVGVLPFFTGTAHLGPVDLNTHIGYQFYNNPRAQGKITTPPPGGHLTKADLLKQTIGTAQESILYGATLKYPVLDMLGLRLELAGQSFKTGDDRNVVAIEPGLDYLVECGSVDLLLSAAGSYGLTGGTAGADQSYGSRWGVNTISGLSRGQWGVGAGLGVLWN